MIFSTFIFSQNIVLHEFASSFTSPVEITTAGDARLFVVQFTLCESSRIR